MKHLANRRSPRPSCTATTLRQKKKVPSVEARGFRPVVREHEADVGLGAWRPTRVLGSAFIPDRRGADSSSGWRTSPPATGTSRGSLCGGHRIPVFGTANRCEIVEGVRVGSQCLRQLRQPPRPGTRTWLDVTWFAPGSGPSHVGCPTGRRPRPPTTRPTLLVTAPEILSSGWPPDDLRRHSLSLKGAPFHTVYLHCPCAQTQQPGRMSTSAGQWDRSRSTGSLYGADARRVHRYERPRRGQHTSSSTTTISS